MCVCVYICLYFVGMAARKRAAVRICLADELISNILQPSAAGDPLFVPATTRLANADVQMLCLR